MNKYVIELHVTDAEDGTDVVSIVGNEEYVSIEEAREAMSREIIGIKEMWMECFDDDEKESMLEDIEEDISVDSAIVEFHGDRREFKILAVESNDACMDDDEEISAADFFAAAGK